MKDKIKPHQTTPYKKGCSHQREYDELTIYGDKHKFPAITTFCDYVDKKGKFVERYLLRVKWISWYDYFEELSNLKMDPEVDESVAKGFNDRQNDRDKLYEKNSSFEEGWF